MQATRKNLLSFRMAILHSSTANSWAGVDVSSIYLQFSGEYLNLHWSVEHAERRGFVPGAGVTEPCFAICDWDIQRRLWRGHDWWSGMRDNREPCHAGCTRRTLCQRSLRSDWGSAPFAGDDRQSTVVFTGLRQRAPCLTIPGTNSISMATSGTLTPISGVQTWSGVGGRIAGNTTGTRFLGEAGAQNRLAIVT